MIDIDGRLHDVTALICRNEWETTFSRSAASVRVDTMDDGEDYAYMGRHDSGGMNKRPPLRHRRSRTARQMPPLFTVSASAVLIHTTTTNSRFTGTRRAE